jgi:Protein of unknown function (DUF4240)
LKLLPPHEIVEFEREFARKFIKAYRWYLWVAAYLIEGGCSDDGFMDFRYWLISMGRAVYEAALSDPDSLVDVAGAPGFEVASFEELGSLAIQVYEEVTGNNLPDFDSKHPHKPTGKEWDEDALDEICPKLYAKYGD